MEWDLPSLEGEGEEEAGEQRTVVVQMAFLDLRGTGLAQPNAARDVVGGSLLVRYVERQGGEFWLSSAFARCSAGR